MKHQASYKYDNNKKKKSGGHEAPEKVDITPVLSLGALSVEDGRQNDGDKEQEHASR